MENCYLGNKSLDEIFSFFNELNNDQSHFETKDDICTPMECVKLMVDYVPEEFWKRDSIKILDPCCGNGNFGAYCNSKTNPDNIYYNELNVQRYENCKALLRPNHITNDNFFDFSVFNGTYDLITANPPYSGGGNKNRSLSNAFIEHSIELLNDKGYLCFITPNNWMTYNNNNKTLKMLLNEGSFLVINNDVKKFFPKVGSSFTIFIWQKGVFNIETMVINNYLVKDTQKVNIPKDIPFIPLYITQTVIDLVGKLISDKPSKFNYRCDLHNYTQSKYLSDTQDDTFKYETIHTLRKTRYASKKQDIYDKWLIIIPLSTYYIPEVMHHVNTTQSVGYFAFDTKEMAESYLKIITKPQFKLLIHLTRYGNFNNIMVLKHLDFDSKLELTLEENCLINRLCEKINY